MKKYLAILILFLSHYSYAALKINLGNKTEPIYRYGETQLKNLAIRATMDVAVLLQTEAQGLTILKSNSQNNLAAEGFALIIKQNTTYIIGADAKGCLYGMLELAEQLKFSAGNVGLLTSKREEPRLTFRALKFNLPYMGYYSSLAITQNDATVRDIKFWEAYLDMMAKNRFNVLSLWSLHPFHYMVKLKEYPEACPYSEPELASWKAFWKKLFSMAHERGIETYLVNWNTFVSPSFSAAHNVANYSQQSGHIGVGDTSKLVEDYTRKTITAVINEYPELDGLGITFGERMGEQGPDERRAWIDRTILAGMKDANRKIKFIYRAPLSANLVSGGSTSEENDIESRKQMENLDVNGIVHLELKYNWSHGHSTPRFYMVHGGKLSDKYFVPEPVKYKVVWTVRNEDFYFLRWGNADFIREFISNNSHSYVEGCFLGSEVFIPALDHTSKVGDFRDWKYHFERQWLWYAMWGRLMYNPKTSDTVFSKMLAQKYGNGTGKPALEAWKIASNNQLRFASYHMGRSDFTLYTEAFSTWIRQKHGDASAVLFDIKSIINDPVLDSERLINIKDWLKNGEKVKTSLQISPLQLADELEKNNKHLQVLINELKLKTLKPSALVEINDLQAWCYFGQYFSDKLKAGVALARAIENKDKSQQLLSIALLKKCSQHWANYAKAVEKYNDAQITFAKPGTYFSTLQSQVDNDIKIAETALN